MLFGRKIERSKRFAGQRERALYSKEKMSVKCEIYRDSMQNYKKYGIPKAQLVIADVPYNVGNNMYGSNPMWYVGGDNKNGESNLAGKAAFNSEYNHASCLPFLPWFFLKHLAAEMKILIQIEIAI